MAPKKGAEEATTAVKLLGRAKNRLSMGLVGLPNVGKSTTFNCLTQLQVAADNFPFCTIEPTTARVAIPDERYDWLCEHYKPKSKVPTYLEVTDIAGLVRGAAQGKGLGNAFLANIRAVDGIFHVVRVFPDSDVTHVDGEVDPVRDLETIVGELAAKDIEFVEKQLAAADHAVRMGIDKSKAAAAETYRKVLTVLQEGREVRIQEWTNSEIEHLNELQLLTAKPVIYLLNMSEKDFRRKKNKHLRAIMEWVKARGADQVIPFCASLEQNLMAMEPEAAAAYCAENEVQSMMSRIITTGYHELHLIHFMTAGSDEVRCWTIRDGCKAPDAAGCIHSDMKNGFICAEVMAFDDLKRLESEAAAREAGLRRQEGRNYTMADGDIVVFKFGRVNPKKK